MAIVSTDPSLLITVPDGVHLGLEPTTYFHQDALGSSDLIRLHSLKHGWWWQSKHNPDRVEKESVAGNYGTALHTIILESVRAYESEFRVQPERPADALSTIPEMKGLLEKRGFALKGTSAWKAADWADAMEANAPDVPCWPNILAVFEESCVIRDRAGNLIGKRPTVTAVEDRMLRLMRSIAMNSDVGDILEDRNHPPLAEVSVLRTGRDGIRRRWRFDRLFPAFTMDLKSLGNWSGRPLKFAIGDHVARYGYDIQRADYDDGRAALNEFVRDGFQVYGGTPEQRDWLRQLVDMTADASWDWVWLFYQKPDPAGRAPVLFPLYDDTESDLVQYGRAKAARALQFYKDCLGKFGLETPWSHVEPTHYAAEGRQPNVSFPHWIATSDPDDAAAYT